MIKCREVMTKSISEYLLKDLFGDSMTSSLCVNIEKGTEMWVATGMLTETLESFTDGVVIREKDKPIGIVGGIDVIIKLVENPTSELFDKTKVEEIMEARIPTISVKTTLKELMGYWKKTRRAFALIPNEFSDYSVISAKKLLEIGMRCKTDISVSDLPEKELIKFSKNDSIGDVMNSMLVNGVRRLLLENTSKFINDRMILEKISEDLKYLRGVDNFLEMPITKFNFADAKVISDDLTIADASKIMYEMEHSYLLYQNKVVTPWDICLILLSEKLTELN
jgi:predicted transcriptional regulator